MHRSRRRTGLSHAYVYRNPQTTTALDAANALERLPLSPHPVLFLSSFLSPFVLVCRLSSVVFLLYLSGLRSVLRDSSQRDCVWLFRSSRDTVDHHNSNIIKSTNTLQHHEATLHDPPPSHCCSSSSHLGSQLQWRLTRPMARPLRRLPIRRFQQTMAPRTRLEPWILRLEKRRHASRYDHQLSPSIKAIEHHH